MLSSKLRIGRAKVSARARMLKLFFKLPFDFKVQSRRQHTLKKNRFTIALAWT